MAFTWKDIAATLVTALAVLVYITTHEGWDVPLIGDSVRWATVAIVLLGAVGCALGSPQQGGGKFLSALGVLAAVLAIVALVTGSLTPLSLLVADIVLLWLLSTLRHAFAPPRPIAH
jgi:hypothetical protein